MGIISQTTNVWIIKLFSSSGQHKTFKYCTKNNISNRHSELWSQIFTSFYNLPCAEDD